MHLNPTAQSPINHSYENPIPAREFIISLLVKVKKHLNREQIAHALDLKNSTDKEALRRRLRAMERDGQLVFDRSYGYQVIKQKQLITGVISIHVDGFGFVKYHDDKKDLFLSKKQLSYVFDGDMVQVLKSPSQQKRDFNRLIKVVERKTTHIAGILRKKGNDIILLPENGKIQQTLQVDCDQLGHAKMGQYVNCQIINYATNRQSTLVKVIEVLGEPNSAGLETKLALRRHGVNEQWDDAVITQATSFGGQVDEQDKKSRIDYRHLPFVTIDGADAKDFDDAVYCEKTQLGGWRLLVAIADVSHYVQPNDPLDIEAQARGTSIYCPGQVIPMLPESLSNGLCSLNPHQDRLVMVCDMTISQDGILTQSVFTEGVIHSHARLTYDQANAIITKPSSNVVQILKKLEHNVITDIKNLHTLYTLLSGARSQRGAIEFETSERNLILNKRAKIARIENVERNDAHRMIEECMLCANVATAQFLEQNKISGLFRVHAGPQMKKLLSLRTMIAEKGLTLGGGDKPSSQDYNKLLVEIASRKDVSVIRTLLLRSQSQAEYSVDNNGHFGLAYDAYAHFTSPIRRYPDLITHRAIKAKIRSKSNNPLQRMLSYLNVKTFSGTTLSKKAYPYDLKTMATLSEHCSAKSRQADEISREVDYALKCQYMEKYIGESFEATISGVTSFGFFVELNETGVGGLVPLSSFSRGEFIYDADRQKLTHGDSCIALGDSVNVVLANVDLRQRKMSFELITHDCLAMA
jgi:ribonuclease R